MAVVVQFGKLADSVIVTQGEPFNEIGVLPAVVGGVPTPLLTFTVPAGDPYCVTYVFVSGRINALVELRCAGVLRLRAYLPVNGAPLEASFGAGGIVVNPGQQIEVKVLHDHASSLDFSCNVAGFKKAV